MSVAAVAEFWLLNVGDKKKVMGVQTWPDSIPQAHRSVFINPSLLIKVHWFYSLQVVLSSLDVWFTLMCRKLSGSQPVQCLHVGEDEDVGDETPEASHTRLWPPALVSRCGNLRLPYLDELSDTKTADWQWLSTSTSLPWNTPCFNVYFTPNWIMIH